jgi:hypothetical protein
MRHASQHLQQQQRFVQDFVQLQPQPGQCALDSDLETPVPACTFREANRVKRQELGFKLVEEEQPLCAVTSAAFCSFLGVLSSLHPMHVQVKQQEPGFKLVEVEQCGELRVLWIHRVFKTYLDVTEDARDADCLKTEFALLRSVSNKLCGDA